MSDREGGYWDRFAHSRVSRRRLLHAAGIGGAGLAGAALIGCAGDDDGEDVTPETGGTTPAAGTGAPAGEAVQGGTLNIHGQDPIGFDPHANFSFRTHQNQSFFRDTLFEYPIGPDYAEGDFTPAPHLAEDYEQQDDVTFVVKLKPGIKWQNKPPLEGRELVAHDVVYTYERMVEQRFTYRDLIEGVVDSMEEVDDQTIKFTLVQPYADFTSNLANHYNWIVAPELDDAFGGDLGSPESAVGLGPFMLERYDPGVKTVWAPNPDYFLGAPNVERVEFLVLSEAATRESMLRAGDLDLVSIATLARSSIEQTNADIEWFEYYSNGGGIFYYGCGPGEIAEDVRVRRGINLAIDREGWLESFFLGDGTIYNGPPVLAAYEDWQVPLEELEGKAWWEYNPDEARKLLDAAGFDLDATYKMDAAAASAYGATWVDYMQLAMDLLAGVGIKTEANLKEYGDWLATGHAGIYEHFAFGPMTPQISIDAWTWGLFHSESGVNKAHLQDPEADRLIDAIRTEYDVEARQEAVTAFSHYISDQAVYVYTPIGRVNYAQQPWVKNFRPKAGYFPGKSVRSAWIDET